MTQSRKDHSDARQGCGVSCHHTSRSTLSSVRTKLPDRTAHLIFWPVVVIGLVLDLWTKSIVFAWVQRQPSQIVFVIDDLLRFVAEMNAGAAWGIAMGRRYLLITVSVAALAVILVVFLLSGPGQRLIHMALGLFAAGVCGNLYDRIFNDGQVRDFIDVAVWPGKRWPAFNVADAMLCVGVGLMILSSLGVGKRNVAQ